MKKYLSILLCLICLMVAESLYAQDVLHTTRDQIVVIKDKLKPYIKTDRRLKNLYINLGQLVKDFGNHSVQDLQQLPNIKAIRLRIGYRIGDLGLFISWREYARYKADFEPLQKQMRVLLAVLEGKAPNESTDSLTSQSPEPDSSTNLSSAEPAPVQEPAKSPKQEKALNEEIPLPDVDQQDISSSALPFDLWHLFLLLSTVTFAVLYFFRYSEKRVIIDEQSLRARPHLGDQAYSSSPSAFEEDEEIDYESFIKEESLNQFREQKEEESQHDSIQSQPEPIDTLPSPNSATAYPEIDSDPTQEENLEEAVQPEQSYEPQKTHTFSPVFTFDQARYFFAEIMMTAGPRKDNRNHISHLGRDLGEDIVGFMILRDKAIFWVMDGTDTSDVLYEDQNQSAREYFSSRYLAQSIAHKIQHIGRYEEIGSAETLLDRAIDLVKAKWQSELADEIYKNFASQDYILQQLDLKRNLICSTSALIGILQLDGRLDACKIGSSALLTHPGQNGANLSTSNQNKEQKRISAVIHRQSGQIQLDFAPIDPEHIQNFQEHNTTTILATTNGISTKTQVFLKNTLGEVYTEHGGTREILQSMPQNAIDDKSCCFIQIREN